MAEAPAAHPMNEVANQLGLFIWEWNNLERGVRSLLQSLIYPLEGRVAQILSVELNNRGLPDAIKALAELHPKDLADEMRHACNVFERLRDYRNHVVHNFETVAYVDGDLAMLLHQVTAKSRLRVSRDKIKLTEIREVEGWIRQAARYVSYVRQSVDHLRNRYPLPQPKPLPEKPPLPPSLERSHFYPATGEHRPRSSPGKA